MDNQNRQNQYQAGQNRNEGSNPNMTKNQKGQDQSLGKSIKTDDKSSINTKKPEQKAPGRRTAEIKEEDNHNQKKM